MTVGRTAPAEAAARFGELLLAMSYADPRCGRCSTWRG